ncbi:MAG: hypothetical protein F6J87_12195 [Spirulina sp. SIO3F2]|nr:hypothetical protein [Spirulina sp. SIO3F2]
MKLQELKVRTQELWNYSHKSHGAIAIPSDFKPELRHFGDLRRKTTWAKAYCHFYARQIHDCCLDAFTVPLSLSLPETDWRYPYHEAIFDEFMKLPGGLALLREGLEQLFIDPDYCTPEEREEGYRVLGLVQGQASRGVGRLSDEFIRRLAGATAGT